MSKEFMLYIRNGRDAKSLLSEEEHLSFVRECEIYIGRLTAAKKLIAAQPLEREGYIITRIEGGWKNAPLYPSGETQVGYYHIVADSMEEAMEIAKQNPEFEFIPSATIEVRPVKMNEEATGFEYPKQGG